MDHAGTARDIAGASMAFAGNIGVDLVVEWQDDQRRLTFMVERRGGDPGSGARAISHLLELADAAGIEVAIDVLRSIPALIRYYWRFGFRAYSEGAHDDELRELERYQVIRAEFLSRPGATEDDLGVTFMWRDAPRGPTRLAA